MLRAQGYLDSVLSRSIGKGTCSAASYASCNPNDAIDCVLLVDLLLDVDDTRGGDLDVDSRDGNTFSDCLNDENLLVLEIDPGAVGAVGAIDGVLLVDLLLNVDDTRGGDLDVDARNDDTDVDARDGNTLDVLNDDTAVGAVGTGADDVNPELIFSVSVSVTRPEIKLLNKFGFLPIVSLKPLILL